MIELVSRPSIEAFIEYILSRIRPNSLIISSTVCNLLVHFFSFRELETIKHGLNDLKSEAKVNKDELKKDIKDSKDDLKADVTTLQASVTQINQNVSSLALSPLVRLASRYL